MKRKTIVSLVLVLSLFMVTAAYATSLNIVLAIDNSGSISPSEFLTMMGGYQAAFQSPAVQNAIVAAGGINVYSFFWATSAPKPPSLGGWQTLNTAADANAYASTFALPFSSGGNTCVSCAISHANSLFATAPSTGHNIIDVSGDGVENVAANPGAVINARNAALAGATDMINGLAITTDYPFLDTYFENYVIGGFGATGNPGFVLDATFGTFAQAVEAKILTEVQGPEPGTLLLITTGLLGLVGFRRKFRS